ncbi:MAG TPA: AbrB/MazE/SpoVT family DNA-binding domain-containing protein [Candidatus Paceibacterota bacterium]
MKVGKVTKATQKGQIVIPKEYRDILHVSEGTPLHISLKGQGIYIQPVKEIIHQEERDDSYLKILEETKGALAKYGKQIDEETKARRKIELAASKRRKSW